MESAADVGVSGAGGGVDLGHASVGVGGAHHAEHRDEDGGDDVAVGFVEDDAEEGHGGGGLNHDQAHEDEVAKMKRAVETRGRVRHESN